MILNTTFDTVAVSLSADAAGASATMPLLTDDVLGLEETAQELLPAGHLLKLHFFQV